VKRGKGEAVPTSVGRAPCACGRNRRDVGEQAWDMGRGQRRGRPSASHAFFSLTSELRADL
jgi:hypothetical protein